jgi:hypothetical protein
VAPNVALASGKSQQELALPVRLASGKSATFLVLATFMHKCRFITMGHKRPKT